MTHSLDNRQVRLQLAGIVKTYMRERKPFTVIDTCPSMSKKENSLR